MKEILETIRDGLKRLSSEGESSIPLDDDSVALLKKLAETVSKEGTIKSDSSRGSADSAADAAVVKPVEQTAVRVDGAEKTQNFVAKKEDVVRQKLPDAPKRKSVLPEERNSIDDGLSEVKFATPQDLKDMEKEASKSREVKARVVRTKASETGGFEIAPIPDPTPFTLPEGDKRAQWEFLRDKVLSDSVCNAHIKPEKKVVFGVGNLDADIFFCGEAPGADEEILGEPFVGRAGQLLTKIIGAMGLTREQVYIGNIMNWRPELPTSRGNRPPELVEMNYCLPYLKAQIAIVKPKVIVALGNTAVKGLLGDDPTRRLGKIRGQWHRFENCDMMITYHPSYLLQYGTPQIKRLVWEDMLLVMEKVGLPISEKQRNYFRVAEK